MTGAHCTSRAEMFACISGRGIGLRLPAEAAEYEKDLPLFQASLEFVKAARTR